METVSKTLVFLEGPSQSGKTQTVKLFLSLLHNLDHRLEFKSKKWIECLEVLTIDGVRVGINSRSDKYKILDDNLRFLMEDEKCVLIFSAVNSKMKGVDSMILSIRELGWEILYLNKSPEFYNRYQKANHLKLNTSASKALYERFLKLINRDKFEIERNDNKSFQFVKEPQILNGDE